VFSGPHAWYVAPIFMLPLVLAHQIDCGTVLERAQPDTRLEQWPFDALVYLLAALQLAVIVGTVRLFSHQGIFSIDLVMTYVVVGGASGFSIITAHELIHRPSRIQQGLGRLLLCTVMYEHFYTEHLRGHHVRVGTPDDPATAKFGEPFEVFFRRTVPAQLRSAWRLEKRRLGDPEMRIWDRRMLRHRVIHGLVAEWMLALGILAFFGLPAFVAFLVQAYSAIRLLEVVNYFEHWGLRRTGHRVRPVDSWDTHSWFTYYGLIGLSRHADHHAAPARPYNRLRVFDEAPQLRYGYVGMVDQVLIDDATFQVDATRELARRRLGPFAEGGRWQRAASEAEALAALERERAECQPRRERGALRRAVGAAPAWALRTAFWGVLLLAITAGVQWETAAAEASFLGRLALSTWALGAFAGVIAFRERIESRTSQETFAWVCAFALLVALGCATDFVLRG